MVALEVFVQEGATLKAGGEDGVITFETAPFGEMVCYVKGSRGRRRVFVIDKGDGFNVWGGGVRCRVGLDNYIAGEEVAVTENELEGSLGG